MKRLTLFSLLFIILSLTVFALSSCSLLNGTSENEVMPDSIHCEVENDILVIGDKTSIKTTYSPEDAEKTPLEYHSSDETVASVNKQGVITANSRGEAIITVKTKSNENVSFEVYIIVENKDTVKLGQIKANELATAGSIPILITSDNTIFKENIYYEFRYSDGTLVDSDTIESELTESNDNLTLNYTFKKFDLTDTVSVKVTYLGNRETSESATLTSPTPLKVDIQNDTALEITATQTTFIPFTSSANPFDTEYNISLSNDNVEAKINSEGRITVTANKPGVSYLTLTVKTLSEPIQETEVTCEIVIKPQSMTIYEASLTYGFENALTLGKDQYYYHENSDPILVDSYGTDNAFTLHCDLFGLEAGEGFYENIIWHSSHPASVTIDDDGKIHVIDEKFNGNVEFYAEFTFNGITASSDTITIHCIGNGVNVYTYRDLYYATKNEQIVILHNNIKDDFGYIDGKVMYTEIHTTYDDTYYKNLNKADNAKIKILISFKNDVYGNGYSINAHNVTYKLRDDGEGNKILDPDALFRGPLNFVMAQYEDDGEISTISVKAQDNICFAVYENVNIRNVTLKGCDPKVDRNGELDLNDLEYVGTTVEVLGDNVNISYSSLMNGRTVLRAFGDALDSTKNIHLTVSNTILNGAREFLLRVGSNDFFDGTEGLPSPNLPTDKGMDYNTKQNYNDLTSEEKASYDDKYIRTYVTLKNSILKDAGLFAIGMDTHFSGAALANGKKLSSAFPQLEGLLDGWFNLAKTSFGAKITFEEEVGLYNWKQLEDINTETLIEVKGNYRIFKQMAFDIKEMIDHLSSTKEYSNIVTSYNGSKMVHAGMVFFGGGKNYSVFESKNGNMLYNYSVNFDDLERSELSYTAGYEPFCFFIYDKTSGFSPEIQKNKLENGAAYECIYKK